jgi:hypothetical protein
VGTTDRPAPDSISFTEDDRRPPTGSVLAIGAAAMLAAYLVRWYGQPNVDRDPLWRCNRSRTTIGLRRIANLLACADELRPPTISVSPQPC